MSLGSVAKTVVKHTPAGYVADKAKDYVEPKVGLDPTQRGSTGDINKAYDYAKNNWTPFTGAVQGYSTDSGNYTGSSTGSGSASSGTNNAADLAYLSDQEGLLRSLLSRTGSSLDQGLTQIGDDYNKEASRANGQRSQTLQDFATKREDTTNAKGDALDRIDTNARTLAQSVRQLIGRASGSGSSAYQITAPGAVARDASLDRADTQETFGRNFRDLDTGEKRASSAFEELLADLADQKNQKERGLREGILTQEQSAQGQLADIARNRAAIQGGGYSAIRAASAPAQAEISSRQSAIDQLFDKYRTPYSVKAVDTSTPTLADYTTDGSSVNAQSQASGTGSAAQSPYARFLQQDDEDNLL